MKRLRPSEGSMSNWWGEQMEIQERSSLHFNWTVIFMCQNSVCLCTASLCTPKPNLPVILDISWLSTFAFQSPMIKRAPFFGVSSRTCRSSSVQFSSVAQSCLTLCDPMNHSTPGLPVHHQIPEFTQTHVHRVWCHPAISYSVVPLSSYPQSLPASGSFPMSQLFTWGGQSIGVPASASVLPMNTRDWSPLQWTGWISLQSKGLSRVFSNTTVQKH